MKKKFIIAAAFALGLSSWFTLSMFCDERGSTPLSSVQPNYESLKACEKQSELWEKIQSTAFEELPPYNALGIRQVIGMASQGVTQKGRHQSDFAPSGWIKYLHRRASIAKVKIVSANSSYTGIFQGADCALLRLSLTYKASLLKPVAPGLALKVLRDGVPSANISALVSLDGQGQDYNFFKHPMSNIVPTGTGIGQRLVHRIFSKASNYPEEMLAVDFAKVDATGKTVAQTKAPRQIFFVPNEKLNFSSESHDVRNDFETIPEGTLIYKIYALNEKYNRFNYANYKPENVPQFLKNSEHIGNLITASPFISSEFGDDGIFFRHQLRP